MQTNTQAVPEGWKLVPIEPTTHMVVCGCKAAIASCDEPYEVYRAMLAAAPEYAAADWAAIDFGGVDMMPLQGDVS